MDFIEKHSLPISIVVAAVILSAAFFVSANGVRSQVAGLEQRMAALETTVSGVQAQVAAGPPSAQGASLNEGPSTGIGIDFSGKELRGDPKAKLTVIEFSDFECPFCKQVQPVVEELLANYSGKINLAYFNLPLHQHSPAMAIAFECAAKQGKRWEYGDSLFANTDRFFDASNEYVPDDNASAILVALASDAGLDLKAFGACRNDPATKAAVQADEAVAEKWGIQGTPTFVINGNKYPGAMAYDTFKAIVERELKNTAG